jgi:hypothetical protein
MVDPALARTMWTLFEPLHAVTYFTPQARAAFEAAGLRGFWRGYFAGRAAPLGPVDAAPVRALFFGFAPPMVARALPDVWQRAAPERVLAARVEGAVLALDAAGVGPPEAVAEAGDLLAEVARAVDTEGRALAAANAALPWPDAGPARLWHAATVLREHRGDGHMAALLTAGFDGCESVVWRGARDDGREWLQMARGWTDDDWAAGQERLVRRGWLDEAGRVTDPGRRVYEQVEATTDRLAARPWESLHEADRQRLAALLRPLVEAAATALPYPNPIGLPRPSA